jgi:putative PIN family toxin of toxin-antitoxin system
VKIVLDTNVLIAATVGRGLCVTVVDLCVKSHHLALSEFILQEFEQKLRKKFHMPQLDAEAMVTTWRSSKQVKIVIPAPVPPEACRDPDDCMILGTALAAAADCLVTGDRDLLVLKAIEGIDILSPRAFYERAR